MLRVRRVAGQLVLPLFAVIVATVGGLPTFFLDRSASWVALLVLAAAVGVVRVLPVVAMVSSLAVLVVQGAVPWARFGGGLGFWQFWIYGLLAVVVAVVTVTSRESVSRWAWRFGVAAALLVTVLCSVPLPQPLVSTKQFGDPGLPWSVAAWLGSTVLIAVTAWAGGLVVRRAEQERVRVQAARESTLRALAVAEREVLVQGERERIAQDVHDVLAHSLVVVVAQAEGAKFSATDPATAAALSTIATAARSSLADVRVLLAGLEQDNAAEEPEAVDLPGLVDRVRAAGLQVEVREVGAAVAVAPSLRRTVHRIVQEALTNALVHGGRSPAARLSLEWAGDGVTLSVSSPILSVLADVGVPAREGVGAGRGVVGMRERARVVGGWLTAGPDEDGTWVVAAFLPVAEGS